MRSWTDLRNELILRAMDDALVIGNGPSRVGQEDLLHDLAAKTFTVACNAYWREGYLPDPDLLVCYDGAQASLAIPWLQSDSTRRLLVPEQRDTAVKFDEPAGLGHVIYEAFPHRATVDCRHVEVASWDGTPEFLGNLAGLLAYQAALVCGAKRVFLLGMDCGGSLARDRVELSVFGGEVPGYDHGEVPTSQCDMVGATAVPHSWQQTRLLWRALTQRAAELGTETFRAAPGGALDWLDVRTL